MNEHEIIVEPRVELHNGRECRYVAIASWRDKARKDANQRGEKTVKVRAEGSAVDMHADLVNDFRVFYKPQATRIQNFGTEALPVWQLLTGALVNVGRLLAKGGTLPDGPYVKETYTRDIAAEIGEAIERYKERAARKPLVYWGDKRGTTLNLQVSANADDASQDTGGGGFSANWSVNYLYGYINASDRKNTGMRFAPVAVPSDATIDSADWQGYLAVASRDNPKGKFYCEDVDDSDDYATTADVVNRTKTTAFTQVDESDAGAPLWHSVDITSALAEVVAREGWASGNDVSVLMFGDGDEDARRGNYTSHNANSSLAPKLDIDYSEGGGGGGHSKSNSGCGLRV